MLPTGSAPTDAIIRFLARARAEGWRWYHLLWATPSLLLIILQVRPILRHPDRTVLATLDGADALLQSGILTWTVRHFWNPTTCVSLPIFYPSSSALMSMDSLLGQAVAVLPLHLLADPTPSLLYNLSVVLTLVLVSAGGALLWLAASEGDPPGRRAAGAGFCALALLGSPFTTWQLGVLNQISPPWIVMLLAALWHGWRRFESDGYARVWWWVAAFCLACQAAWGWYGFAGAVFVLGTCVAAGLWCAVRGGRLKALLRQSAWPLVAAGALVLTLAFPYLQLRAETDEFTRELGAVSFYSSQLRMLGNPGPHRLALADLDGIDEPATARAMRNTDGVLHPGWMIGLCALVGLWQWRRLPRQWQRFGVLITAVGAVGFVMSFGDSGGLPPGSGRRLLLPFGVLREVLVPFQAFRAPVRFIFLANIALAWWAAVGMRGLWQLQGRGIRRGLVAAAWGLLLVESIPVALHAVPVPVDGRVGRGALPAVPADEGAVLSLPAPPTEADEKPVDALWLHRSLATGLPVTGGLSGWVPPVTQDLRRRLFACESGHQDVAALLDSLRATGVVGAEVVEASNETARVRFWLTTLDSLGYRGVPTAPGYRYFAFDVGGAPGDRTDR